jgi:hypothetical protein
MTDDLIRKVARAVARRENLDPAAKVLVGALAVARYRHVPVCHSAEERAELLSLAETSDGIERFTEAATSRAHQFVAAHWKVILRHCERLSGAEAVLA